MYGSFCTPRSGAVANAGIDGALPTLDSQSLKQVRISTAARLISAAALVIGCAGCGTYIADNSDELSDNAIDIVYKQISLSNLDEATRIRNELLRRVPPSSGGSELRSYLDSMGADCAQSSAAKVSCKYITYTTLREYHYLFSWRYSEREIGKTIITVTMTASANATIAKSLSVNVNRQHVED